MFRERLLELFSYDKDTGRLIRKIATGYRGRNQTGTLAGSLHKQTGYIFISVDNRRYLAHRVIWLMCYGVSPEGQIDHINGNRADNRLCNLRDVSRSVNQQNRRTTYAKSGFAGAYKKGNYWYSKIGRVHLGYFKTAEEAHAAYIRAKRDKHIGCTV